MDFRGLPVRAVFYGDDVTGASDNAAQFWRHGLRTVLFFGVPDAGTLARTQEGGLDVIGIAGVARSLPATQMAEEVGPALDFLQGFGAPVLQYKCCSTLDSSPEIGSLGEASRLLLSRRPGAFLAVLAAMPEFARYTVFGQHFAGFGPDVFRLDRHPSMARHPVTPAYEADIRALLASQGCRIERLVDLRELEGDVASLAEAPGAVFDSLTDRHLETAAGAIWHVAGRRTVAAVAAQGFAHGIGLHLRRAGLVERPVPAHRLAPASPLLVLSGSCSPRSASQIAWAEQAGFATLALSPAAIRGGAAAAGEFIAPLLAALRAGRSVVAHTARGPDDPAVAEVTSWQAQAGLDGAALADRVGALCAALARAALAEAGVRRLVLAGGDSSSFTMRHLGASAIEMEASLFSQNAHVGRLRATDQLLDGVELLLKGGQVGAENLYGVMREGF